MIRLMPQAAQLICRHPGCGARIPGKERYCSSHALAHEQSTPWSKHHTKRVVKNAALSRARKALFEREPLCAQCKREGRVSLAEERDHIIPLSQGGPDTESNTQGLCKPCHARKSEAEKRAGAQAARQDYQDRLLGVDRSTTIINLA